MEFVWSGFSSKMLVVSMALVIVITQDALSFSEINQAVFNPLGIILRPGDLPDLYFHYFIFGKSHLSVINQASSHIRMLERIWVDDKLGFWEQPDRYKNFIIKNGGSAWESNPPTAVSDGAPGLKPGGATRPLALPPYGCRAPLRHPESPATVAPFRAWRGSPGSVAQDPAARKNFTPLAVKANRATDI